MIPTEIHAPDPKLLPLLDKKIRAMGQKRLYDGQSVYLSASVYALGTPGAPRFFEAWEV